MKNNERRFIGLDQPLTNSRFGYFNSTTTSNARIQSNLKHLLLTNQGERIGHPSFGCDVYKTLFENIDNLELPFVSLKDRIIEQVSLWMPYIVLNNVNIVIDEYNESIIHITLVYVTYGNQKNELEVDIVVQ